MPSHDPEIVVSSHFGPKKKSNHVVDNNRRINTSVCRFLDKSGPPKSIGRNSESKASIFVRLIGEEEWFCRLVDGAFCEACFGVLISSVFMISSPRRSMD